MSDIAGRPSAEHAPSEAPPTTIPQPSTRWMGFVLWAGVVLPSLAIGAELCLRICSSLFNVIPTNWHLLFLALVPVSSAVTLAVYKRPEFRPVALLSFLVGTSIGTSLIYSVEFLPILPACAFGALLMGLGLLGFSPYFAVAASVVCSRRLGEAWYLERRKQKLWLIAGIVVSILLLGGYTATSVVSTRGMRMAASGDEATSIRGVKLIRTFGNMDTLLRACYELPTDPWAGIVWEAGWDGSITREQARTVYYRVTGQSFNSVPPPRLAGPRSALVQDFDWDSDVGGTAVNGVVRSLSLASSRIDGRVDPEALTSYSEWTMVFTNTSSDQREARAEIALPHGAVVSRLTLWINGEEREAAFGARGVVREAYRKVAVVQSRDPVLVTTCGPDRVLMQCFPVPPNGGKMKVRLGITSPLELDGPSRAAFALPRFVEHNFGIDDEVKHSISIESPEGLAIGSTVPGDAGLVRGTIADGDLAGHMARVTCARKPSVRATWAPDPIDPQHYAIVQTLQEVEQTVPRRLIVVIDGSRRLRDSLNDIAQALPKLPGNCRLTLIRADEEVSKLEPAGLEQAQGWVRRTRCVGGIDNRPALVRACELAADEPGAVVLWVHGPQPLESSARGEQLLQIIERRGNAFSLMAIAAADGRNSILSDLDQTGAVTAIARRGTLGVDLERLFGGWRPGATQLVTVRERVPLSAATGVRTSGHIARLWARDEVLRACRTHDSRKLPDASRLACQHQVVTQMSGAVVLENEEQYKQSKLKPVDPKSVPSIVPEPASWIVLASGIAVAAARLRRRRCR